MRFTRIPKERRQLPRSGWVVGPHWIRLPNRVKMVLFIGWWKIEWYGPNVDKSLTSDPDLLRSLGEMARGESTIVRGETKDE